MIAETIALGILSLPSVVAAVGLVPYVTLSYAIIMPLYVIHDELEEGRGSQS